MTGTDLVYSSASLDQRKDYAQAIARAGDLLPKSLYETYRTEDGRTEQRPSPGKILLIAETGNMLGIHPIAALNGVNVIEGKPTVSPALMRALIQRAGHKVRVRETGTIEGGDYAVTVEIVRSDDPDHPYTSTWTPHRGARAGLCAYALDPKTGIWKVTARSRSGNPLPWEAYTEALCLARATREVANQGASDVIMGVYLPEELGAVVNESGEIIDVTSTAVDRTRYEQDEDGPAVVDAMRSEETGKPESEPEQGIVGKARGLANETDVLDRPNREPSAPPDTRPRPSRTKAEPGAGRTDKPKVPTVGSHPDEVIPGYNAPDPRDEDRHHIADEWADRARKALTVTDARDLYRDANHRGLLDYPTSSGELLGDVLRARGEHLADEEAHAAEEADEMLNLPIDVPTELPY